MRNAACCMQRERGGQRGVSLLAAVFIIVILAFMGVMFVSLITTSSLTAINDMQSMQAFFVAESGVEFEQMTLALNLDWYRSTIDPITVPTTLLSSGSFTVSTYLPGTELRTQVSPSSTSALRVYSVDLYPTTGSGLCLRIDNEFISYTGVGTTNVLCSGQPPCFTGISRGAGACFGGGTQELHKRGTAVYPASTLQTIMPANCNDMASLTITANTKFLSAGTLDIEQEEVSYAGSSTSGALLTLTGIRRCLGNTQNVSHATGAEVTPVLVGGDTASYQAEISASGSVGAAVRGLKKTIER